MALCLECKADYLPHITVCPACNRALEIDATAKPPPASAEKFVPFLTTGYPEGMAAAASLEAAGLETRLATQDFHIYLAAPLYVTVLVRERDLDAASAALRRPAPPVPLPEPARCAVCGTVATVHESELRGKIVSSTSYCADHAKSGIPVEPCHATGVDEEVRAAVEAINARKGVRTVCSCSGAHAGAVDGFISFAPLGADAASTERFDSFVTRLQDRVRESGLESRVSVDWSAVHGAEINLVDRARARETWAELAGLIDALT